MAEMKAMDPAMGLPYQDDLSQPLDLFLSCRNVPKMDVGSPSDPFVVISTKDLRGNWVRMMQTEVVDDNPNPDFTKPIQLRYEFETIQHIRCDVYDSDDPDTRTLSKHDYIGYAEFVLGDLVSAGGQKLAVQLKDRSGRPVKVGSTPSIIIIRCEEIVSNADEIIFQFRCRDFPKPGMFSKPNPFLQLYRVTEDGGQVAVAKTEVMKKNYNPVFQPMKIRVQRLCNGDFERPVVVKAYSWNSSAQPDFIGEFEASVTDLMDTSQTHTFLGKGKKRGRPQGSMNVPRADHIRNHSFVEYIMGGCEIQLFVAIDFTASNVTNGNQLHGTPYFGAPNSPYLAAIQSVGSVLEPYDSDNMIPTYGFGAVIAPRVKQTVSHCFPLTQLFQGAQWVDGSAMNKPWSFEHINPEVQGLAGVVQAYQYVARNIKYSGPTLFHELIDTVCRASSEPVTNENQHYSILLILTDGVVSNVQKAVDAVVAASFCPISIIIVGIGSADFSAMDKLDADDVPLRDRTGRLMARDCVQFVEFDKFKNQHPSALAKETLEEVPRQLLNFMKAHGVAPGARTVARAGTMANLYAGGGGGAATFPVAPPMGGEGGGPGAAMGGPAPGVAPGAAYSAMQPPGQMMHFASATNVHSMAQQQQHPMMRMGGSAYGAMPPGALGAHGRYPSAGYEAPKPYSAPYGAPGGAPGGPPGGAPGYGPGYGAPGGGAPAHLQTQPSAPRLFP